MNIRLIREIIAIELGFKNWKRLLNSLNGDKELIEWYNHASNERLQQLKKG